MDIDENILIDKAKDGNVEAFEEIVNIYQKKVYNIALRMLGNREDANELAQEVFIKVYKALPSFKGNSSFSTWLYRVTMNVCTDELRKRKNKNVVYLEEKVNYNNEEIDRQIEDESLGPPEQYEKKRLREAVIKSINLLPQDQKIVIVLRDIHGFDYRQISEILKCPEGTIKSRLNRARKALKEILTKDKELFDGYYVK